MMLTATLNSQINAKNRSCVINNVLSVREDIPQVPIYRIRHALDTPYDFTGKRVAYTHEGLKLQSYDRYGNVIYETYRFHNNKEHTVSLIYSVDPYTILTKSIDLIVEGINTDYVKFIRDDQTAAQGRKLKIKLYNPETYLRIKRIRLDVIVKSSTAGLYYITCKILSPVAIRKMQEDPTPYLTSAEVLL